MSAVCQTATHQMTLTLSQQGVRLANREQFRGQQVAPQPASLGLYPTEIVSMHITGGQCVDRQRPECRPQA